MDVTCSGDHRDITSGETPAAAPVDKTDYTPMRRTDTRPSRRRALNWDPRFRVKIISHDCAVGGCAGKPMLHAEERVTCAPAACNASSAEMKSGSTAAGCVISPTRLA